MSNDPQDDVGHLDTRVGTGAPAAAPAPVGEAPKKIGKFAIGQRLGRGGMATVYLALEQDSGREVALKLMNQQLAEDAGFVERFKAEARATSSLKHPNIVGILGYGDASGVPWMATEYCDGGTVGSLVDSLGEVPVPVAIEIMAQFLSGLGHAHERGVIHRDLKPENLLLNRDGYVKLADFGIAKVSGQTRMTNTGMLVGTASYMSPEQARGDLLDGRSDLYSAGIIFYELLAGVNPFDSDNPATSLTKILTNNVTPLVQVRPAVQPELEVIIEKLMAFDALDRFSTAEEALQALAPLISQERNELPQILMETLKNPELARAVINRRTAEMLFKEAQLLALQGIPQQRKAAMKLYSATHSDPEHAAAQTLFTKLSADLNLNFGPPTNPKIAELEAQLRGTPANLQLLTQLSNLYKLEGNVLRASAYLRRYVRLKPEDGYAASQLTQLTGELPQVVAAGGAAPRPSGPSTAEIMSGVQTGGFKAAKPVTGATPAQQTGVIARRAMPVIPLAEVKVENPWFRLFKQVMPILLGIIFIVGAVRFTMRFISTSADAVDKDADALNRGLTTGTGVKGNPMIPKIPVAPTQAAAQIDKAVDSMSLSHARTAMQNGNFDDAVAQLDSLIAHSPDSLDAVEAEFVRAQALMGAKKNGAAMTALTEFMTKRAENAHAAEALLLRGQAAQAQLDFSAAEADYSKFISDYPRSKLFGEALLSRGELRHQQGNDALAKGDFVMLKSLEGAPSGLKQRAATLLENMEAAAPK